MARSGKHLLSTIAAPVLSLALAGGILAEARSRVQPADAEPYHQRCKAAIDAFPLMIGDWTGTEVEVPASATQLLRPNVILSRRYVYQGARPLAGGALSMLLVQCTDARDLQGHYPPRCYPANGDKVVTFTGPDGVARNHWDRTWQVGDMTLRGTEYQFDLPNSDKRQIVYNFFVIPHVPGIQTRHPELDGVVWPDMDGVYKSGEDYQRRYYGAAEFQAIWEIPIGGDLSVEARDEVMRQLLGPNESVIRTLMNRESPVGAVAPAGTAAAVPAASATASATPVVSANAMMTTTSFDPAARGGK